MGGKGLTLGKDSREDRVSPQGFFSDEGAGLARSEHCRGFSKRQPG